MQEEIVAMGFRFANLFVLPFWALMIFLPRWSVTLWVIRGWWYLLLLSAYYVAMLGYAANAEVDFSLLANPTVEGIHQALRQPAITPAAWAHYLAFDLVVGRWMFLREPARGYWLSPILFLTLMVGPGGLLVYILLGRLRQSSTTSPSESS